MTDLDPKVRDRAAQAAFDAFYRGSLSWETATESFKDRWRAVAEVLAAERAEFKADLLHDVAHVSRIGHETELRLQARLDELTAALTRLNDAIARDMSDIVEAQREARAALATAVEER